MRVAADGTIASYEIETSDGTMTTRHRKYIQKIPNLVVSNEDRESTRTAEQTRASKTVHTQ